GAPIRCRRTSSASACSASPRRPTTTRRRPSRTSRRTPDPPVVDEPGPVDALFSGAAEIGRTDAVLVQRGGSVLLERYGEGIDAGTALGSWSMAKSMLHAAVGMLVDEGALDLDAPA